MRTTRTRRGNQRTSAFDDTATAVSTLASTMVSAVEDFLEEMATTTRRERRPRRSASHARSIGCPDCGRDRCECAPGPCGCDCEHSGWEECGPSSCDCVCCVGDVDLVVYTRLGEQRVVPIEIHNPRRREREVEVEVGPFTTRSGKPAGVVATLVGGGKFTLAPCATHEVILVVRIAEVDGKDAEADDVLTRGEGDRVVDVDDCLVAVADLRILGCDMRPKRIALAILPRRCAAYEIECQHGCC